jgi:hypothetical protein
MYAIAIMKCQMQESLLLKCVNITLQERIKIKAYFIPESCKKKVA